MSRRLAKLAAIEGEAQVRNVLRDLAETEGVRGLARRLKVTPNSISLVIRGKMQVSARLAKAVGYRKVIRFEKMD